jgi:hypothetical protein
VRRARTLHRLTVYVTARVARLGKGARKWLAGAVRDEAGLGKNSTD